MAVKLHSKNGKVEEFVCNGDWSALIAATRAYEGDKIPTWDGSFDGAEWTPEQLKVIHERVRQMTEILPILEKLIDGGGVKIS